MSVDERLLIHRLPQLREAKGRMSRSVLSRTAVEPGFKGVAEVTIKRWETEPGHIPTPEALEAFARALDASPEDFYEYPIAVARRLARQQREAKAARSQGADEAKAKAPAADHLAKPAPRPARGGRRESA